MKQKDILLISVVVFVSAVFSLVISNVLVSPSKNKKQDVEVVLKIEDQFRTPDPKYFNAQSIDPTKQIQIGDDQNAQPFNGQ